MGEFLFSELEGEDPSPADAAQQAQASGMPRLRVPQRNQVEMHWLSLDEMLEPDHQARTVWAAVCRLDLSRWLAEIKAVEGSVGRNATDPRLLVGLSVYATLDGVGSSREVARLCTKHLAYQWLCGGVSVNYHMLADFRSQHGDKWDDLLTQIIGTLMAENLVTMQCVAQDGMKVRAHAGKGSFRRNATLERHLQAAREQIEALKTQEGESSHEPQERQRAARKRAAEERARRVEEAMRNCEALQQQREESAKKSGRKVKEARASTTDPEARTMQFSDGGFRPGYNVQFSTDTQSGLIVGVDVTNAGNDLEELPPMLDQLHERYGKMPEDALVDGGFVSQEAIESATDQGVTVYAPLKDEKKQLDAGKDPYAKKKGDSLAMQSFRSRMGHAASKFLYRLRCQTAEWVNAVCRNWGLWQMPVRGQTKCRRVATLFAITHDLLIGEKLRASAAAGSK